MKIFFCIMNKLDFNGTNGIPSLSICIQYGDMSGLQLEIKLSSPTNYSKSAINSVLIIWQCLKSFSLMFYDHFHLRFSRWRWRWFQRPNTLAWSWTGWPLLLFQWHRQVITFEFKNYLGIVQIISITSFCVSVDTHRWYVIIFKI